MNKYYTYSLLAITNIVIASMMIRVSEVGAIASGGYRLLLAIPFLILMQKKSSSIKLSSKSLRWALFAGLFFALDLSLYNVSLIKTTIAEANLFTNLAPFFITPIAIIFLGERVQSGFYIASFTALIGIALLMNHALGNQAHLLGNLLALASAIFYTFFLTSIKKASENSNASELMIYVSISGSIALFFVAYINGEILIPHSIYGWTIVIAIAFLGQVCGQTLLAHSIKYLPLQIASMSLLLSPIFAAIFSWLYFNEVLTLIQIFGITLILFSLFLAKKSLQK